MYVVYDNYTSDGGMRVNGRWWLCRDLL